MTRCAQCRPFHKSHKRCLPLSPEPEPSAGYAALPSRRLISLSGPDVAKFLQGVITRNIYDVPDDGAQLEGPPRKIGIYAAFLTAQGRMLNDIFIYPDTIGVGSKGPEGETFLVEVDAAEAETFAKYIKRYKLRSKFEVRMLEKDEATVWHAWGEDAAAAARHSVGLTDDKNNNFLSILDTRCPGMGFRVVSPNQEAPQVISQDFPLTTEGAYTIRRYLNGIPEGQEELLHESAFPLEGNVDLMGGIDYRKGCYVGQELTIRTKHRGVVRKRILPVVLYGPQQEKPGSLKYTNESEHDIYAGQIPRGTQIGRFEKTGRSVGKFLKGVGNVGLALCKLEVMTDIKVPGTEGASMFGSGFDPQDEFVLETGDKETAAGPHFVKVKAFAPDWLRSKLKDQVEH